MSGILVASEGSVLTCFYDWFSTPTHEGLMKRKAGKSIEPEPVNGE
jgi:hypothetical protein